MLPKRSANCCQYVDGKTNKQLSSPLVITAPLPSSLRNLAGMESRFLGSIVCLYSPISIDIHCIIHFLPLNTTVYVLYPTFRTPCNVYNSRNQKAAGLLSSGR